MAICGLRKTLETILGELPSTELSRSFLFPPVVADRRASLWGQTGIYGLLKKPAIRLAGSQLQVYLRNIRSRAAGVSRLTSSRGRMATFGSPNATARYLGSSEESGESRRAA